MHFNGYSLSFVLSQIGLDSNFMVRSKNKSWILNRSASRRFLLFFLFYCRSFLDQIMAVERGKSFFFFLMSISLLVRVNVFDEKEDLFDLFSIFFLFDIIFIVMISPMLSFWKTPKFSLVWYRCRLLQVCYIFLFFWITCVNDRIAEWISR